MTQYPLLFTFRQKVEGNNYLADVKAYGRLLAEEEDGTWWMYGVNPGGLAASGSTRAEAYSEFRETLAKVLYDLATDVPDFHAFRGAAQRFFYETDQETVSEWEAARELVKSGEIDIKGMRREESKSPALIEVDRKQEFHPQGNTVDSQLAVAA